MYIQHMNTRQTRNTSSVKLAVFFAIATTVLGMFFSACSTPRQATSATNATNKARRVVAALHDPTTDYVVVVAHRGDWRNHPENSLAAIESAIRMGVDIMELDLKMTKDSVLVLSHDPTLDRMTTGHGPISDYTYAELMRFDLKRMHGISIPGLKMPTLRKALEVCKDRIVVNVDQGYDYYDQVLAITEELGMTDQVLIKSGRTVQEVRQKLAQHPRNMMYMPVISVSELPKVLASGSKLWVNTIWGSLCGNYDDDRAYENDNPDAIYGPILDLGTSIIQTDRPEFLIRYLEQHGRRRLPKL